MLHIEKGKTDFVYFLIRCVISWSLFLIQMFRLVSCAAEFTRIRTHMSQSLKAKCRDIFTNRASKRFSWWQREFDPRHCGWVRVCHASAGFCMYLSSFLLLLVGRRSDKYYTKHTHKWKIMGLNPRHHKYCIFNWKTIHFVTWNFMLFIICLIHKFTNPNFTVCIDGPNFTSLPSPMSHKLF